MRKRVFLAINLPAEIKSELLKIQKQFPTLPGRFVKDESLHLTLIFLGDRTEEELEKITAVGKKAGERTPCFDISFGRVCYGPGKKLPPRLIWAEGEKSEGLITLKKNLDKLLAEKISFQPERQNFLPHITLARIKAWDWKKIEPEERPEVNLNVSFTLPVSSFELMQSDLKRSGAEYQVLESFSLGSVIL